MSWKSKDREILEAIKGLDSENDREAAINQLILSANLNQQKLSFLLEKMNDSIRSSTAPSSPSKKSDDKKLSSLAIYTGRIINELSKNKANISLIIQQEIILTILVNEMTTSVVSLESLLSISVHEQGKSQLVQVANLISSIVVNILNPNPLFFQSSFLLLHNLLDLGEMRKIIQSCEEFGTPNLYSIICQAQNQLQLEHLCFVLMQISRCKVSHQAMFTAEGVLPLVLSVISSLHHPLAKLCIICLMNLSSEVKNRLSIINNDQLLQAIISLARNHKGKIRQCSLGVLLNISYVAIDDVDICHHLLGTSHFLETVLMGINANGEISTQLFGMGILSNITSSLENKIKLIQCPLAQSILPIICQTLLLDEVEVSAHSPRHSASSKASPKYWLLKNDCSQVLLNLSRFDFLDDEGLDLPISQKNVINGWKNTICLNHDLFYAILSVISISNPPNKSPIRTTCLRVIESLQPTLSFLLSSDQSHNMRTLFTTIRDELKQFTAQASIPSNEKILAYDILDKINPYIEVFELVQSESKMVSPRSTSKKHLKCPSKRQLNSQPPNLDTLSIPDGKFSTNSSIRPSTTKKSSSKKENDNF